MANVVRDPRAHPEAIVADFATPNPLVTFTKDDVAWVYGSRWKQRYFKRSGDDYVPLPAQWDVTHQTWKRYFVADGTDWWTPAYPDPGDDSKRPTGPLCDGCHSVDYDVVKHTVAEWNVGCEKCHGPGSEHVANGGHGAIYEPPNAAASSDTCIQCHAQGRPLRAPTDRAYDWPVGYRVGDKLADFWRLEEPTPGRQTFTHFADGTAHKNRMQGNDFVQSVMYARGVSCASCHDPHGSSNPAGLRKPAAELCLTCHAPGGANGPKAATIEGHTHHAQTSAGSACVACHMPKIAQTIGDVNVRSHTFKWVSPETTEALKVPNACGTCHADKGNAWVEGVIKSWR